eukprot:TRINITY_DN3046_c0_g1_i1.p3 TRINITY_DN3046_c0_g1~~TRINITY_DN3046_c0_g1_i1.p3  ORF type:complete len:243 (+),score=102.96 TRINITY_DN3046_c0_g1_i1:2604-3332(+)
MATPRGTSAVALSPRQPSGQNVGNNLFKSFTAKKYAEQAQAFLNAYWGEHEKDAEQIWKWTNQFIELDHEKKAEGCDLDEFNAHRFLEKAGETKRVVELREELRAIDMDFNKRMAIIEYLLFKFKRTVADFVKRPQGTNEELAKAQAALQEAQNEIARIEAKKNELQEKSNGTGVAAMRAKNELEQLLSQDNTELNKRTLTAEAAVRKAQKLGGEAAQGALWWINRELEELKKYKPKRNLAK